MILPTVTIDYNMEDDVLLSTIYEEDSAPSSPTGLRSSRNAPQDILSHEDTQDASNAIFAGEKHSLEEGEQSQAKEARGEFRCEPCNFNTHHKRSLLRHETSGRHNSQLKAAGIAILDAKRYSCPFCSDTFSRYTDVGRHIGRKHNGRSSLTHQPLQSSNTHSNGLTLADAGPLAFYTARSDVDAPASISPRSAFSADQFAAPQTSMLINDDPLSSSTMYDCLDCSMTWADDPTDPMEFDLIWLDLAVQDPDMTAPGDITTWEASEVQGTAHDAMDGVDAQTPNEDDLDDDIPSICSSMSSKCSISPRTPPPPPSGLIPHYDRLEIEAKGASSRPRPKFQKPCPGCHQPWRENEGHEEHSRQFSVTLQQQLAGQGNHQCTTCEHSFKRLEDLNYHLVRASSSRDPRCGFGTHHQCSGHHPPLTPNNEIQEIEARADFLRSISQWEDVQFQGKLCAEMEVEYGNLAPYTHQSGDYTHSNTWTIPDVVRKSCDSLVRTSMESDPHRHGIHEYNHAEDKSRRPSVRQRVKETIQKRERDLKENIQKRERERRLKQYQDELRNAERRREEQRARREQQRARQEETERRNEITRRSVGNPIMTWTKL